MTVSATDDRPLMWFACPKYGEVSEAWMVRQAWHIDRLRPHVVCWAMAATATGAGVPPLPLPGHGSTVLGREFYHYHGRAWRWLRVRNAVRGNYWGTVGDERAQLVRLMREQRPRVVLGHFGFTALRVLPAARRAGVPVVAHFNGVDASSFLLNPYYRRSMRVAARQLAGVVVVARYMYDAMRELGVPSDRLHLIPYGVPVGEFRPADPGAVAREPCRFLAVGRLVDKKDPLAVVRAFAACAAVSPGATLTVIGHGPLDAAARALARELKVADRVTFLGAQSGDRVRAEMAAAGAFVQHSVTSNGGDKEGWPVAIAEAVASGLPVVATAHAAIPQQVEDGVTGYVVPEHDWQAMGDRMARLAGDGALRARMGVAARAKAEREFDFADKVRQLQDVLLDAARRE